MCVAAGQIKATDRSKAAIQNRPVWEGKRGEQSHLPGNRKFGMFLQECPARAAFEMMENAGLFSGDTVAKRTRVSASSCGSVSVSRKSGADELNHLPSLRLSGWRDSRCEMALTAPNWVRQRSRNAPRHDQASLKITPR